jgi:hypothetical protein
MNQAGGVSTENTQFSQIALNGTFGKTAQEQDDHVTPDGIPRFQRQHVALHRIARDHEAARGGHDVRVVPPRPGVQIHFALDIESGAGKQSTACPKQTHAQMPKEDFPIPEQHPECFLEWGGHVRVSSLPGSLAMNFVGRNYF